MAFVALAKEKDAIGRCRVGIASPRLRTLILAALIVALFFVGFPFPQEYRSLNFQRFLLSANAAQGNNAHVLVVVPDGGGEDFPFHEVHSGASLWSEDSKPTTIAALKSNVTYVIPAHYVFGKSKAGFRTRNVLNADSERISLERTTVQPEAGVSTSTTIAGAAAASSFGGVVQLTAEYSMLYFRPSDEWVVLNDGESQEGHLLHCRLPLPVAATDVKEREAALLLAATGEVCESGSGCEQRANGQNRLGAMLWKWILEKTDEFSPEEGCLHGDGEGGVTDVSQWYIFCPRHFVGRLRGERERQQRRKIRQWRSYLRAQTNAALSIGEQAASAGSMKNEVAGSWWKAVAGAGSVVYRLGARLFSSDGLTTEQTLDDTHDSFDQFFDEDEYAARNARGNEYDEIQLFSHSQKIAREALAVEGKEDGERFGSGKQHRMETRLKKLQTPSSSSGRGQNENRVPRLFEAGDDADGLDADSLRFSDQPYVNKFTGVATIGGDDAQEAESSQFDAFKTLRQMRELEIIGVYDPLVTPNARWSATHQAWEFFFPSEETLGPRGSRASNYVLDPNAARNRTVAHEDAVRRREVRQAMDTATSERYDQEYRRLSEASTVVRLRCTTQKREGHLWAITQVRQTHRFVVELGSTLVCPWDIARNTLRMNPILCNALE